ncbi:hypothetical protein CMI37_11985 [Candidatus Pacearchaeota archaeon]|nr:hypothetical protein [Candidatus Pacearchaeota archaeon]
MTEMAEILFKDNKIQTGYRVKIPKAVVDTLELKEGQGIEIRFNIDKRLLIIEEDKVEKVNIGKSKTGNKGGKGGKKK